MNTPKQVSRGRSSGRPWLVAAAVIGSAAAGQQAAAQSSVVLYGEVDAGVVMSRSGAPGAGTLKSVASGISRGSLWGLRGSEDLGGGLKAIFRLEQGFALDTGALVAYQGNPSTATPASPNGTASTGFNRRSYVGLSGGLGTLTAGRDYAPVYYAAYYTDIFRTGMFGNIQEATQLTGGVERSARLSNGVFYVSPSAYGLRGRVAYSFGSESDGAVAGSLPARANNVIAVGGEYTVAGLLLTGSYSELNLPVVAGGVFTGAITKRKDALIGARYDIGDYAVTAGYLKSGSPQNATDAWLGASASFGASTVLTQIQRMRQDNPTAGAAQRRGNVFGLAYTYSLSKRSELYATYGQVSNNQTAAYALIASDVAVVPGGLGATPKAVGVGMRHSF